MHSPTSCKAATARVATAKYYYKMQGLKCQKLTKFPESKSDADTCSPIVVHGSIFSYREPVEYHLQRLALLLTDQLLPDSHFVIVWNGLEKNAGRQSRVLVIRHEMKTAHVLRGLTANKSLVSL